jgi:hypothetical protein
MEQASTQVTIFVQAQRGKYNVPQRRLPPPGLRGTAGCAMAERRWRWQALAGACEKGTRVHGVAPMGRGSFAQAIRPSRSLTLAIGWSYNRFNLAKM